MPFIRISDYKRTCILPPHVICRQNVARNMKRKVYCCDASRHMYEDYYSRQAGGEMPVFVGSGYQGGHGLGSVLGGIFRRFVIPFFKTHGKTLASNALKTGMDVAEDVLGGRMLKESAKIHVPEGIKRTAQGLVRQSGSNVGRRGHKAHKKRKIRTNDIFA